MKTIILALLCFPSVLRSQEVGIHFESGLSWEQIKFKAKAENKYIFMDCYATWCGPCKWMARNIFSDKEVGEYFNSHFINVAVQLDRTNLDSKSVTKWYPDADSISKQYEIHIYPTYLFFAPDGHIVHRFIGASKNKSEFINKSSDAIKPESQYYTIVFECKTHQHDSAFLMNALQNSLRQEDYENAAIIGDYYLNELKDPLARDNIVIICRLLQISNMKYEKGNALFLSYANQLDTLLVSDKYTHSIIQSNLADIIFEKWIKPKYLGNENPIFWTDIKQELKSAYPGLSAELMLAEENEFETFVQLKMKLSIKKSGAAMPDWNDIFKKYTYEFPGYDITPIFLERKTKYYRDMRMWKECVKTAYTWIHQYGVMISDRDMNNITWDLIFEHTDDKKILMEAIKWMKRAVDINPSQPNNIDTYANLLYKCGNTRTAKNWEVKAIELTNQQGGDAKSFQGTLEKMNEGLPTWGY